MKPVIIVGAGLAGYTVARELRKLDKDVPLVIVTSCDASFYSKPMLSNAFAQGKSAAQLASHDAAKMAAQLNATILAETEAFALDTSAKTLTTSLGVHEYGKLVLALGAAPIRLKLDGDAADDVISVNHLAHYAHFRGKLAALDGARRVAILGAGLIGCEFADDLSGAGHAVTLIDPQAMPLAALAPAAISAGLSAALGKRGVALRMGVSAAAVNRVDDGLELLLNDGSKVVADAVLSAVGLRPNLDVAQAGGLHTERGIAVDAFGQTSAADVYALGDCAQYGDENGSGSTLPYVAPLMSAARAIAATLAGTPTSINLQPTPVIVKTPSYPIALLPAPMHARASGNWQSSTESGSLIMRFRNEGGSLCGFGVAPSNLKLQRQLLDEMQRA